MRKKRTRRAVSAGDNAFPARFHVRFRARRAAKNAGQEGKAVNELSLAFASAGAALAFEGPYCAISACAFALSAVTFSFVRKKACVAVIACGGAATYLYFLFTLYGAAVSFTFAAFAALSR